MNYEWSISILLEARDRLCSKFLVLYIILIAQYFFQRKVNQHICISLEIFCLIIIIFYAIIAIQWDNFIILYYFSLL